MASTARKLVKPYVFPVVLISSILLGGVIGYFFEGVAPQLKPLGDIFLNLLFAAIVPLVFFSVSSAISRVGSLRKLSHIFFYMTVVFISTGALAALSSLLIVKLFPLGQGIALPLAMPDKLSVVSFSSQLVGIFTVRGSGR